jgi:hypothetical protein
MTTTHLTTSCVLKFVQRAKKKTVMEGGVKSEIINVTYRVFTGVVGRNENEDVHLGNWYFNVYDSMSWRGNT